MAEALLNARADGRAYGRSAGSRPAKAVHPEVVEAMAELKIDLSRAQPKSAADAILDGVDVVVTMGCGDECPYVPGAHVVDWDISDPAGRPIEEIRAIRDDIASRVDVLLTSL
jgi:arsenate reductase